MNLPILGTTKRKLIAISLLLLLIICVGISQAPGTSGNQGIHDSSRSQGIDHRLSWPNSHAPNGDEGINHALGGKGSNDPASDQGIDDTSDSKGTDDGTVSQVFDYPSGDGGIDDGSGGSGGATGPSDPSGPTGPTDPDGGTMPVPEFSSTIIPTIFIIGFLGIVLLIQRTKEN